MTLTSELAEYFSATKSTDVRAEAAHHVKRLLIDYFAVAIAGSRTDSGRLARDFAVQQGGSGESSIVGRGDRVPAVNAAFANAIAEHSIELDDIDVEALFHYGPPVISAALAAGEANSSSGAETLAAAVAGCEMMNRLSRATNPALRDRGFHTTPTCGVFGAAVAAGRLFDLDPAQMTSALGLAGAQAGGLMEMYGTSMQKRFNPGPAARDGVTAARMAKLGFTGADTIIEGERGFAAAFAGTFDAAALMSGLGSEVPIEIEFKPYSCARPIHNAIDCALRLRAEHRIGIDDIDTLHVGRHPSWARYHLISSPRTHHEAQVSLPYSVAVAFADGVALPAQYADERLADDAAVRRVAELVTVSEEPELQRGVSCHLVVTTIDGRSVQTTVDYPKGSVQNPMSDAELVAKLGMLAEPTLDSAQVECLAAAVFTIEDLSDVNDLLSLTY